MCKNFIKLKSRHLFRHGVDFTLLSFFKNHTNGIF